MFIEFLYVHLFGFWFIFFGSSLYYIELKCKFLQNHTHACYIWRMKFLKSKYKFYSLSIPTNKIKFTLSYIFQKQKIKFWCSFGYSSFVMISQYLDSNFINDNCKYLRKKILFIFSFIIKSSLSY